MPVPILLYHHINVPPQAGIPARSNYVHPRRFFAQMRWLKRLGFQGLSLQEGAEYIYKKKHGKIAIITFDDGFRSVYDVAMPILNELGFTATCFFVLNQINGENNWDRPEAPRQPCMNLSQMQDWIKNGHEAGSHSLDHVRLTALTKEQAREQIAKSKLALEDYINSKVRSFAYPYGAQSKDHYEIVNSAGYDFAVTTHRGRATPRDNPFALPRHSIRRNDTIAHFLLKCLLR